MDPNSDPASQVNADPETQLSTLRKIPFMYSQKRNWSASVPISTFMCLWAIYIFPGLVHLFSCSRIGRPIAGTYKSLTGTWIQKLGLRPRNSLSGNICVEFSVVCLCIAELTWRVWGCNGWDGTSSPPFPADSPGWGNPFQLPVQ